jgi:hypothetical protein
MQQAAGEIHASCSVVNWRSLLQKILLAFYRSPVFGLRFRRPPPPPTELENTQSHYSILVSSQAGYYLERAEYDRRDATLLNLGKS